MIALELFLTFFKIGLFTFGGGYSAIPLITQEVLNKAWLTEELLVSYIAIGESTPGPFSINIATLIGSDVGGFLGSVCATLGFVMPSLLIIIMVAILLAKFMQHKGVRIVIDILKPVMVGLILSAGIFIFLNALSATGALDTFIFDIQSFGITLIIILFMYVYKVTMKKKMHPISIVLFSALLGMVVFLV